MKQPLTKRVYLDTPPGVVRQVRLAASQHRRSIEAEAIALLEQALQPDPGGPGAVCTPTVPPTGVTSPGPSKETLRFLDLPEDLVARLTPLADVNFRSLSSEVVFVLQTMLRSQHDDIGATVPSWRRDQECPSQPRKGR